MGSGTTVKTKSKENTQGIPAVVVLDGDLALAQSPLHGVVLHQEGPEEEALRVGGWGPNVEQSRDFLFLTACAYNF